MKINMWVYYRKKGLYEKCIKRVLDVICSLIVIVFFWWIYLILAILVRVRLGTPILFKQPRPGMIYPYTNNEQLFDMYKFRTMSDAKDENGNLLPDEKRLSKFGKILRATSLDELPEIFNILKGDMSIIGPRPQLVRDKVFMSDEQRMRHTARPGLSGLAQVKGRNAITWEDKINWDLQYINRVTFLGDFRIMWQTLKKVFLRFNVTESNKEIDITLDYGDWLLKEGKVSRAMYDVLQVQAKNILKEYTERKRNI